ncbi:hypothetical protein LIA77_05468 [Sarocladium implicatum]|nr:hypothetical protein LIA77_05468 [Sarocladium implicatum]
MPSQPAFTVRSIASDFGAHRVIRTHLQLYPGCREIAFNLVATDVKCPGPSLWRVALTSHPFAHLANSTSSHPNPQPLSCPPTLSRRQAQATDFESPLLVHDAVMHPPMPLEARNHQSLAPSGLDFDLSITHAHPGRRFAALLAPCIASLPRPLFDRLQNIATSTPSCLLIPSAATGTLHHVGFGSIVAVQPARNNGPPLFTGTGSDSTNFTVAIGAIPTPLRKPCCLSLCLSFFFRLFLCLFFVPVWSSTPTGEREGTDDYIPDIR